MKRLAKMFAVTSVAALALAAMVAASASAATFTASATGTLTGVQTNVQVYETGGGGSVSCKKAHTTGTISSTAASSQHVTVLYAECSAFGFALVTVSPVTLTLHANGEVDVTNTITITVNAGLCSVTVPPQSGLKSVSYDNSSGKVTQTSNVSGIKSTNSGFLCPSGNNGTYTGSSLLERVGGGSISWDA